jgi:hypothetical protein
MKRYRFDFYKEGANGAYVAAYFDIFAQDYFAAKAIVEEWFPNVNQGPYEVDDED